jgi:RNA polymerase sigma-70 factor (ECF subfamily)
MSSAALIPWSLERSEPFSLRRVYLSVCPSADAAAPRREPLDGSVGASPAAAENAASVPPAPSVAVLHGAGEAPAEAPSTPIPPSRSQPSGESLRAELVAMLPSLQRRAYRWCRDSAEAQDLAQDTVMRALGNGPSFDSHGHLRAWLYTVLRNLFISRRRRDHSWQKACGELSGLAHGAAAAAPAAPFLTPSVERAIARLPEAFARVIRLVDLEDYSYADAASALGVPVGTVMSRLFRARQRLAQDLPALI